MKNILIARYPHKPIAKINSLLAVLGLSAEELDTVIASTPSFYRKNKPGTNGRITYSVLSLLKKAQRRIKKLILDKVIYPDYLHAFIKKRDIITNAKLHTTKKILFNEDIKCYFDNCSKEKVYRIWKYLFMFPSEIADILTMLTTMNNALPQGAYTSPGLSNLLFWQDEPQLCQDFHRMGLSYSRYADDITVSSANLLSAQLKTEIISKIYGMLIKNGFKPKRQKHRILTSSGRMIVNNQIVNRNNVSIGKNSKGKTSYSNIRAALHALESNKLNMPTAAFMQLLTSTRGRLNHLARYHKDSNKIADLTTRLNQLAS